MYGNIHSLVYNSSGFDKRTQCNHHCDQDGEQYCPLVVSPFPYSQALATSTELFSVPIISPFPKIHINGIHTVGDLWVWLLWLGIMHLNFSHVVVSALFSVLFYIFHYMDLPQFSHHLKNMWVVASHKFIWPSGFFF